MQSKHLFCSCHGRGTLHFLWMLLAMCLLRWAAKTKRQKRRRCQCHLWGGHGFWWCEMWFHNFWAFWHETWFPDCAGFCDAILEWLIRIHRIQLICYMHPVGLLHRSSWFVTYPSCSATHPTDIEATGGNNIYHIILHYIILCYIILYYVTLFYYIILYYIILYNIVSIYTSI